MKIIFYSATVLIAASILFFSVPVYAQGGVNEDLKGDILEGTAGAIGGSVQNGKLDVADPRAIVVQVVNGLLLLVGGVFLIYTIYAGFLYMTARGDTDQVKKAISVLRRAIVGVAIVLLSLSITRFVQGVLTGGSQQGTFVGIGASGSIDLSGEVRRGTGRSMSCWATFGLLGCE